MGASQIRRVKTALENPVFLDDDFLSGTGEFIRSSFPSNRPVLVIQRGLENILGSAVSSLRSQLPGLKIIVTRKGERNKSRREKERLEDALLDRGFGRDTLIIALGGGTLTDLAGFTAGTFARGVPWVAVPSTLLAMVDAAIGGKTGVNVPAGKNLIGLFHNPAAVFDAPGLLSTLPAKEWREGLAECIKHGLIADARYFGAMAATPIGILRRERDLQEKLIAISVRIKGTIVASDPFETSGARNLLNAGHTAGHAIELLSKWRVSHGSAVAAGLCWEAACACAQGFLPRAELREIARAVSERGFAPVWERFSPREVLASARSDKKNRGGKVMYVPLGAIGRPALPPPHTQPIALADLAAGLRLLKG